MDESKQEEVEEKDEDDSDYGGGSSSKKSKKRGKKRKAKDSKKSSKKKKKRKANSDLSDNEPVAPEDEEDFVPKASSKSKKTSKKSAEPVEQQEDAQPTVSDVCENFGLNDVDFEYTDADYQNLTTYKLFQQTYRSRIQSANPKVPQPKLMMLLAAKWREFQAMGSANDEGEEEVEEEAEAEEEEEVEEEEEEKPRGRGARRNRAKKVVEEVYDFEEDEDDDRRRSSKKSRSNGTSSAAKSKKSSGRTAGKESTSKKGKVPTLKIKLGGRSGKRSKNASSEDEEEEAEGRGNAKDDSDAEFEEMLKIKDDDITVVKEKKKKSGDKAKMKVGSKNKKKGKKKKNFANDESEHQEYCEVCQQGGEIILCDTCPKAYHLVCLDPELDEAPEGKWSCPHCETNGPENVEVDEDDEHMEFCRVCKDGGDLLCCDSCPSAYHLKCLDPPLDEPPEESWTCPRCACEPLPGKVEKILTWRWKEEESSNDKEDKDKDEPEAGSSKMIIKPSKKHIPAKVEREFFIKFKDQSYWHCSWVQEIQLDVFHTQTLRMYLRKNDMDEPPRFDEDGDDEMSSRRLKHHKPKAEDPYKMQERFFRYGIRPEWLQIHHVISKRQLRYVPIYSGLHFKNYLDSRRKNPQQFWSNIFC